MRAIQILTILTLTIFILIGCNSPKESPQQLMMVNSDYTFKYDLKSPKATYKLNNKLIEISALSQSIDGKNLLTVNDEKGKVFILDKNSGEILNTTKFHKKGDYEGIEIVGDKVYVLKNNGKIYEISDFGKKSQNTESYSNFLNSGNNVEGLGYDAASNQLLLACKGRAGKGDFYKKKRAVYGFDLATKTLKKDPVLLISRKKIGKYIGKSGNQLSDFLKSISSIDNADSFAPSAIAVHPITKDWYVLSSVGKLLLVIGSNGEIEHIEELEDDIYRQPEGLCFDPDGTMYISSEGKGGRGRLIKVSMK